MHLFTLNLKHMQGKDSPNDALLRSNKLTTLNGGGELEVTMGSPPKVSVPSRGQKSPAPLPCPAYPLGVPWGAGAGDVSMGGVWGKQDRSVSRLGNESLKTNFCARSRRERARIPVKMRLCRNEP